MTLIRQLLRESIRELVEGADELALDRELRKLADQHPDLMADAWPTDGVIWLNTLMARLDAPPGSGSRYMEALCEFADQRGLTIVLQTATRSTQLSRRPGPEEFKRTTSGERLKKWYRRFGFLSNSAYGRFDLRGNMFRPPSKRRLSEAEHHEEPWRLKLEGELTELEDFDQNLDISLYPLAKDMIYLERVNASRGAPTGTGTRFMEVLCEFADQRGLTVCLALGMRGDFASKTHKRTSSTGRLRRFYGRFGFTQNSRSGRYDLPGHMHRTPRK